MEGIAVAQTKLVRTLWLHTGSPFMRRSFQPKAPLCCDCRLPPAHSPSGSYQLLLHQGPVCPSQSLCQGSPPLPTEAATLGTKPPLSHGGAPALDGAGASVFKHSAAAGAQQVLVEVAGAAVLRRARPCWDCRPLAGQLAGLHVIAASTRICSRSGYGWYPPCASLQPGWLACAAPRLHAIGSHCPRLRCPRVGRYLGRVAHVALVLPVQLGRRALSAREAAVDASGGLL